MIGYYNIKPKLLITLHQQVFKWNTPGKEHTLVENWISNGELRPYKIAKQEVLEEIRRQTVWALCLSFIKKPSNSPMLDWITPLYIWKRAYHGKNRQALRFLMDTPPWGEVDELSNIVTQLKNFKNIFKIHHPQMRISLIYPPRTYKNVSQHIKTTPFSDGNILRPLKQR